MGEKLECEIHLSINEDGFYEVAADADEATRLLLENNGAQAIRTVKIKAWMTTPDITEVEVHVPDEAGETTKVEAA